jgi:type IV secretory pathway TrbF-like protein
MQFFNESNMLAEKYVVKQSTFTVSIKWAERVWQYGGQSLEQDKSARTIVTAADNPQEQPRDTTRQVWQV